MTKAKPHKTLGDLHYDAQLREWRGEAQWGGAKVALSIPAAEAVEDARFDAAAAALARLDADSIRSFVADELLDLYNETWSEADDISAQSFIARISPSAIEINEDGVNVFFAAGDLFHDHSILVTIDEDGELVEAKLVG